MMNNSGSELTKKDLEEIVTPMRSSLQEIYFILEDFRDIIETHLDALLESQQ